MKKKKRNQTVSLATYRRLIKQARAEALALGYSLKVYRRPPYYSEGGPRYGSYGRADANALKLTITGRGRPGRGEILFTVFHELRHAMHHRLGMYPAYYTGSPIKDGWLGLEAEVECNDYAHKRLLQEGVWTRPDVNYPGYHVNSIQTPDTHRRAPLI